MNRVKLLGCLLTVLLCSVVQADNKPQAIGAKVADIGGLRDLRGNARSLHSFKDHKAVVLVFLGTECPISNLYVPTLLELEKQCRDKKVQFLAIYPNETEDLDQIGIHSYDRSLPFPILKDPGQKLAEAVGITRVPSVAALDGEFNLRYRGRIDDRYGVSYRKQKATRNDLAEAIDEVLAGKKVTVAEAEADGCMLDRGGNKSSKKGVNSETADTRLNQNRYQ